MAQQDYYLRAGSSARRLNKVVGRLARYGLSLMGSAELSVRGRRSGQMQRIPVNTHTFEGERYLVSARGHSQWVRNMRVAGGGELRLGRRVTCFTAVEIADDAQKARIVRAYLERWGWEVDQYFQGVTAKSTDAELLAACPDHPVFRLTEAP
ncbi:nitroreductase/quinone reductase family protein [Streptomyces sp. NPDC059698]|uniref:nitroreductase/quinone reductase family protein n=1 Tax=unclassified Streptomyces TaxID=2593676 RepID=UPI00093A0D6A|nr:nitroreductase/quinone reductase family protein [Streptomyces sp. CB02366]OKJ32576.1 deazaflavin-dependent nitroreductase [Streptomyces sp. CB02366]TVP37704.1 deazaflavin-dependent nitroreductase [Streptomyces griseus subsp. griseus]WSS54161.1 nitroreductase/quinone reductase family protein [Streptomyces sp. NBC_01178]